MDFIYYLGVWGDAAAAAAPALLPGEGRCEEEDDDDEDDDDEDVAYPDAAGCALPEVLAPDAWADVWVNEDDDDCLECAPE